MPFPTPETTTNPLLDIIKWINSNSVVILYNKYGNYKCYYNGSNIDYHTVRIIIVEFKTKPHQLEDDEWPYYIQIAGCKDVSSRVVIDNVNKLISENSNVRTIFRYST